MELRVGILKWLFLYFTDYLFTLCQPENKLGKPFIPSTSKWVQLMENKLFDFISKYITLSEEEKNTIVSLDIFWAVKKGSILLKEGQHSLEGYFVLKGCLRTFYIIDGDEKTTTFYTELEGITPNCVLSKQASEYYISCAERFNSFCIDPGYGSWGLWKISKIRNAVPYPVRPSNI